MGSHSAQALASQSVHVPVPLYLSWGERQRLIWALLAEAKRSASLGEVEQVRRLMDLIDRIEDADCNELTPDELCST